MYLPDAIEEFNEYLATLGLADSYVYNLGRYMTYLERAGRQLARDRGKRTPLKVAEIDGALINAYFGGCKTTSNGHRNAYLQAIRKFLDWCEYNDHLPAGKKVKLLGGRKEQKHVREEKWYVPPEDFPKLIESAERHPADRVVIALALGTLGRASELNAIRLKDIDLATRTIKLYRKKLGRWTDLGMSPDLVSELSRWLEWYARKTGYITAASMMEDQPDWRVIPGLISKADKLPNGRYTSRPETWGINPNTSMTHLERVVKRGLTATGARTMDGKWEKHLGEGVHTIRRSGARAMFKHLSNVVGRDDALLMVSVLLDHSDTTITLTYIGMDKQRDELNDLLRNGTMYGSIPAQHNVIPLRRKDAVTAL